MLIALARRFADAALRPIGAVVAAATLSMGCATFGDYNYVSLQEEWQLGQRLERDIAREMRLLDDPAVEGYVDRVGQRIANQTELAEAPWRFHVVVDPSINAFNVPGGLVYVHTGLICATDNVAELAGVVAHEAAHGAERHGTERLSKAYEANMIASIALGANPPIYQQILAQIVAGGTFAKFGRDAERDADRLGVVYMYNAGYDPHGMATMFQELLQRRQREPSAVAQFFSSHPLTEERIQDVRAQIEDLPPRQGLVLRDAEFQRIQRRVQRYCR